MGTGKERLSIMVIRKSTKRAAIKADRYTELKAMLEERRRELMHEVQGKIRNARADGNKERDVYDEGETSEVDIQDDIEFALIQMKTETLQRINEALGRLEEGKYGNCFECGEEIAPNSVSVCWRGAVLRRHCSRTCRSKSDKLYVVVCSCPGAVALRLHRKPGSRAARLSLYRG